MQYISNSGMNHISKHGAPDGTYWTKYYKIYEVVKIEDEKVLERKYFDDLAEAKKWADR